MYKIILIPDKAFSKQSNLITLGRERKPFISTSPAQGENYANFAWWKLKLAAEKMGMQVRAYTNLNMLPLAYPMSDALFLTRNHNYVKNMYAPGDTVSHTHFFHKLPNEVNCNSVAVETNHEPSELKSKMNRAVRKIPNKSLIDRFPPNLYIRQSTYDLFQTLDLPEKVIMCELREDHLSHWHGQARRQMTELKFDRPTMGIDQKWQKSMIQKVGNHWLGIQVLGSLLKDWVYVCEGGSANLHTLLPTRCVYLKDQTLHAKKIIRLMSRKRLGKAGKLIPIVGSKFWRHDEIKENFKTIQEGINLLEKPEVSFENFEGKRIKLI